MNDSTGVPYYIALDHYGAVVHLGRTTTPRKALMNKLDRRSARKIFRDQPSGPPIHVGYIVAGRWFEIFRREERAV